MEYVRDVTPRWINLHDDKSVMAETAEGWKGCHADIWRKDVV